METHKDRINLLKQPDNSPLCGQTCIAMICGITLEEATREFGHAGSTNIFQLEEVLSRHGFFTQRISGANFSRGVVRLRSTVNKKWSHFAVMWDGKILDPWFGADPEYPDDFYISTTLMIRKKNRRPAVYPHGLIFHRFGRPALSAEAL